VNLANIKKQPFRVGIALVIPTRPLHLTRLHNAHATLDIMEAMEGRALLVPRIHSNRLLVTNLALIARRFPPQTTWMLK
tara:strand:- start:611 stop:847 length:237 start_codon:yes stop_codon:yes gene_type:complete